MEKELSNIERFQEFLDYFRNFEKKFQDLLSQSKTNLGLKMRLGMETEDFCMRVNKYKSLIQSEEVTAETFLIRQEISDKLREIKSLVITICDLPTPELE